MSLASVQQAAEEIRNGGLVAFPTETVYGLGANALDPAAVARIFEMKGRPSTSPLIVHVASVEMVRTVAAEWPPVADALAARFWPGPLTLVVPKLPVVPDIVTAGLNTVAVRMPAHPLALELIHAAGVPVAAPSANRFTQLSPTTAEHVRRGLPAVATVLDGGPTQVGIESTVLTLAATPPAILREGMVTREQIEAVIGTVEGAPAAEQAGPHASPGMHIRHYCPRTRLTIGAPPDSGRFGYVWWLTPASGAAASVRLQNEPEAYARDLYAVLHELDGQNLDLIVLEPPPEGPGWAGIHDRLRRAAVSN